METFWLSKCWFFRFFFSNHWTTFPLKRKTAPYYQEGLTHLLIEGSCGFDYSGQQGKWEECISSSADPPLVLCLDHSDHLFPFLPPAYPLLSQFTLFLLPEVLNHHSLPNLNTPHLLPLSFSPSLSGVLSQFTLILWGTGPSVINPSSSDFPRPSNNSCKTFDAQQICIGEIIQASTQTWSHLS